LDDLDARVEGLDGGGDDYMTKPFAMPELIARSGALLRRAHKNDAAPLTRLRIGELEIDLLTRTVSRRGIAIDLQPQEFKLLEYLAQNSGRVATRTMLLEQVWGLDFDPGTTVIESHISRLRSKIDRGFRDDMIRAIRGAGYLLRAP